MGGETTVTVSGSGRGGRNQELALAAGIALHDVPGAALMSLATDGVDGPTDAAGALVDGESFRKMRARDVDPKAALAANDAYPALQAIGALLQIGPTHTNLNDLVVALAYRSGLGPL
jgi:hydroxypyruvate reductase